MRHEDITRSTVRQGLRPDAESARRTAAAARSSAAARSESRHDRFHGFMDDGFIERYAAKCADDGTIIIAYIEDGVVRGAAELHPPDQSPDALPEIAFSVEASVRRQGVGSILFKRLIAEARWQGLSQPADHHRRAERGDAGARQQVRRASDVPPRRIHRHHRSEAATAARTREARDRRRRSRPRARWSISIAPIGRCCCGCMAGAGRPEPTALRRSQFAGS